MKGRTLLPFMSNITVFRFGLQAPKHMLRDERPVVALQSGPGTQERKRGERK